MERIRGTYEASVKRGSLKPEARDARMALIEPAVGLDAAGEADVIVEAVFEEMSLKKEVFGTLDRVAKPGAVIATNTSYLDIDEMARATSRPGDVLGMHFFSPANVMKLLEVVRGAKTSPDALATAVEVGGSSARWRWWWASATASSATGCWRGAPRRRSACCWKARCRRRWTRRWWSSASAWGPSPWRTWRASTSAGGCGARRASARRWRMRWLRPDGSARRRGKGFYLYPEGARTGLPDAEVAALIEKRERGGGCDPPARSRATRSSTGWCCPW
jgi:3-hydroxyacyl-CoA dehydrogenase